MGRGGKKTITIPEDIYHELIKYKNNGENTAALMKRLLRISKTFYEIYESHKDVLCRKVMHACDSANIMLHHAYDNKKRLEILNKIISVLKETDIPLSETEKALLQFVFEDYNEYTKFIARVNNMSLLFSLPVEKTHIP